MEFWKDIPGYEDLYQVSNIGNIRSLDRFVDNSLHGKIKIKGKLMSKKLGTPRYYCVHLTKNGKRKSYLVHRLVGLAFIHNLYNYSDINHKNLNRLDNRVENLEWMTRSQNCFHAIAAGHRPNIFGEKSPNAKLKESDVLRIRSIYSSKKTTHKQIANEFNVSKSLVEVIVNRKAWKHL